MREGQGMGAPPLIAQGQAGRERQGGQAATCRTMVSGRMTMKPPLVGFISSVKVGYSGRAGKGRACVGGKGASSNSPANPTLLL